MEIAVLLTCFNRKEKTINCLKSLFIAQDYYNNNHDEKINLYVFLTDDKSTDGTSECVSNMFKNKNITILNGSGSLYWNGGMILAWEKAIKEIPNTDFYLLLNDDVNIFDRLFDVLFKTDTYCLKHYNKIGLYSGLTCSTSDENLTTYGGDVFLNKMLGTTKRLLNTGQPQRCDIVNANVLFVHKTIVDRIGIFWSGYMHGYADNDYAIKANKKNIPVFVTGEFCGSCDNDHLNGNNRENKIMSMTLLERKKYFNNPLHSNKDYLNFIKRNFPIRYPLVFIGRILNLYFPKFYYVIHHLR